MVLGEVSLSPYHDSSCENYLHAKCNCIVSGMEFSPYKVHHVESKPYQEIYYIDTPDGIERYDIRYKKGGVFLKTVPQKTTEHSFLVSMIMDNEREMPLVFNYTPSDDVHRKLYELIRHASDTFAVQITNVVEHKEDYSVVYYFRTSGANSYLKVYINDQVFVTYAKPMSLIGLEDQEFKILLDYIINLCE